MDYIILHICCILNWATGLKKPLFDAYFAPPLQTQVLGTVGSLVALIGIWFYQQYLSAWHLGRLGRDTTVGSLGKGSLMVKTKGWVSTMMDPQTGDMIADSPD